MPVRRWTTKRSRVIRRNRRTPSKVSRVSGGWISQDADWTTTAGGTRKEEKRLQNEPERRKKRLQEEPERRKKGCRGNQREENRLQEDPERRKKDCRRNQRGGKRLQEEPERRKKTAE